jgi:hypothetical protein
MSVMMAKENKPTDKGILKFWLTSVALFFLILFLNRRYIIKGTVATKTQP